MSDIQMKQSTYIFKDVFYFFSPSECIDYALGVHYGVPLQVCLSQLEETRCPLSSLFSLFSHLFTQSSLQNSSLEFTFSTHGLDRFLSSDGLKLVLFNLKQMIGKLTEKQKEVSLEFQLSIKCLLNIAYVSVFYLEDEHGGQSVRLNQLYVDLEIDEVLMEMVTISLEGYYIPIKKLTMFYVKVLSNLFHHQEGKKSQWINPGCIYTDDAILRLPYDNLLMYGTLENHKAQFPPKNCPQLYLSKINPIQNFYRKHNAGECPLAQSIVVGLLRSLLTICSSQAHSKFKTVKGGGADSFREWQLTYRYVMEHMNELSDKLSPSLIGIVKEYQEFDSNAATQSEQSRMYGQFYLSKIYTASAVTTLFMVILLALHQHMCIQYSYFLQLISDANGILVFLKFLTCKFSGLETVQTGCVRFTNGKTKPLPMKEEVMLTVFAVLNMLYTSCNNYPEKIRDYLFQYNSYYIIKKIPGVFQQSAVGSEVKGEEPEILRKLSELCADMLRIQIPFFSKKMKESSNNLKMMIDIYCKYPRKAQPIQYTAFEKILLKHKSHSRPSLKPITSVDEMKNVHNEYNNLYYWANDYVKPQPSAKQAAEEMSRVSPSPEECEKWLEANVWRYYD